MPAWDGDDEATAALPDGADFDPTSLDPAWGDGGDATAAIPCMDIGAVATSSVTATRKRKGRGKCNHVAQDARKSRRTAALLLTTQDNTETGT